MAIICSCNNISRDEIVEAIKAGANTLESIKKATGATLGDCNGSKCEAKIIKLIKQYS